MNDMRKLMENLSQIEQGRRRANESMDDMDEIVHDMQHAYEALREAAADLSVAIGNDDIRGLRQAYGSLSDAVEDLSFAISSIPDEGMRDRGRRALSTAATGSGSWKVLDVFIRDAAVTGSGS